MMSNSGITGKTGYEERWFSRGHLKTDLKKQSIRGGISTVSGQVISLFFTIGSTAVMARLLTPDDFGLVVMVTAFTGFISAFKDLGLSAAVIQREIITQRQVSVLFWLNIIISFFMALVVALSAPLLVYLYAEDKVFNITLVFAIGIFISGFSLQHSALMKRQMKFKNLAINYILCSGISVLTGIFLAYKGYGYWAVVISTVLTPVLSTISLWFICDWRPLFIFKFSESRTFLKFGLNITGFDLINYFSRNADNMLIGKYLGTGALGLYSKAYQLLLLPITQLRDPLNAVALPALSSLQAEKEKFRQYYSNYIFLLSFFSMPLVLFLAIFSDELILIVLGDKWISASYIFKLLAITSFIQPVASTRGAVMIATGNTKRYLIWGFANAIFVILGFIIGIYWGIPGVAISYAIVNYLLLLPSLYYSFKDSVITVGLFFRMIRYPLIISILSGLAMYSFRQYFVYLPVLNLFFIGLLFSVIIYLSLWCLSKGGREKLRQLYMIRQVFMKKQEKLP